MPVSRFATRSACTRMSGTATLSQKVPRVTGPIAESVADAPPSAPSTRQSQSTSKPMRSGSGRIRPAAISASNKGSPARTMSHLRPGAIDDPRRPQLLHRVAARAAGS